MSYLIVYLLFRWNLTRPFITITVITVIFLIPPFFLISYITIYILISYMVFRKGYRYIFLIVTTETVTDSVVNYSLIFSSIRPFRASRSSRATPQTYLSRLKPLPPIFVGLKFGCRLPSVACEHALVILSHSCSNNSSPPKLLRKNFRRQRRLLSIGANVLAA